jgi:hypothetical protein
MAVERAWIFGDGAQPWSFDCVVRELGSSDSEFTENPVETGVPFADHGFRRPRRLEVECIVTDTPLHDKDVNGNAIADVFAGAKRSATALEKLLDLQEALEPFDVQTGLRLWQGYLIEHLEWDTTAETAEALWFRAVLREVFRLTTATIIYPPRAPGATSRRAAQKTVEGEKKTKEPTATERESAALTLAKGNPLVRQLLGLGAGP